MNVTLHVHHTIELSPDVWLLAFICAIGISAVALCMLYPMLVSSPALLAEPVEEPAARQPMGFHP